MQEMLIKQHLVYSEILKINGIVHFLPFLFAFLHYVCLEDNISPWFKYIYTYISLSLKKLEKGNLILVVFLKNT